jgi:hypothetical protein
MPPDRKNLSDLSYRRLIDISKDDISKDFYLFRLRVRYGICSMFGTTLRGAKAQYKQ